MNTMKRTIFETALTMGNAFVAVIAVPGLELPPALRIDGTVLKYGYNMPRPVTDLEVTDEGIAATLSFNQTPVKTFVPWSAVVIIEQTGEFKTLFPIEVEQFTRQQRAVA